MKIVNIIAGKLFSCVYQEDSSSDYNKNEYDRLMNLWGDPSYLRNYAKNNKILNSDISKFVNDRLKDAKNIEDFLDKSAKGKQSLKHYFRPLRNLETGATILSLQKGKTSAKDGLRLYAIKIDDDCFLITGGAIKMGQAMQSHPDTNNELLKIRKARDYLKDNGVSDKDSFYEFKNELE